MIKSWTAAKSNWNQINAGRFRNPATSIIPKKLFKTI